MPKARKRVSLNIKNPEVCSAASRLAHLRGTTITEAVLTAVQTELKRQETRHSAPSEVERMERFGRRIAAMTLLDTRTEDEILGYGRGGYPVGH